MNTGENLYLSSRVSSPLYDIGAWLYFITGSMDIAFFTKYIVLTLFAASGLTQLIKRSTVIESRLPNTKFLIFAVLLASMMGNPLMLHEAGPMVLWYLFLTPSWITVFLETRDLGLSKILSNWKTYALIILTIGSSDLFIFFYFPLFIFLAFIEKSNIYLKLKNISKGILFIELLLITSKLLYFYYKFQGNNISHSGSWGLVDYIKNFVAPLFLSVFLPFFWGPVIIFLNFALLGLIVYFGTRVPLVLKKYLIIWLSMLLILLLLGIFLHSVSFTREALPSAFRYHVAPWSIFVISMFPFFLDEVLKKTQTSPTLEGHRKTIITLVLIAILSISNIEQFYGSLVSARSKRTIDYDIRQWITKDMPNCIIDITTEGKSPSVSSQYVFLTQNNENGRNDNLTSLIENPWALNGRTFNQWRYSTSKSNYFFLEKFGLEGLNTWAYTEKDLTKAIEYANALGINYLVTTTRLAEVTHVKPLGQCHIPKDLRPRFVPFKQLLSGVATGNTSYQKDLFIYKMGLNPKQVPLTKVSSNRISYKIVCNEAKIYGLTTNYSSDLKVTNYENAQLTRNPESNLTTLKIKSCLGSQIKIEIKSQSNILFIDVFFLVLYLLMFMFLIYKRIYIGHTTQ